ncbi:MAG: type II toxin-antitoxin system HicB family antitoxin [Chloroflexi bacterium]|nr:type II toxin-antitoxin system HicB family antitoxin [Chloroflexota bacterium]
MTTRRYTILLHRDPETGGYTVTVPALPGCVTQGSTLEEAIALARDAIQLHIPAMLEDGEPIPEEDEHPQALVIDVGDVAA